MKTKIYIPFLNFIINRKEGLSILYENLVQSGPAYKLIVHESREWLNIKDKLPNSGMIEIISDKKAEEYKETVNRYFSPILEAGDYKDMFNMTMDLRQALSYILIAHDYKARIFEDMILKRKLDLSNKLDSNTYSEEAINRVKFVEHLLKGYMKDNVETLSINKNPKIFQDLSKLLNMEKIKLLSEKNHKFGILNVKKDILKNEIKNLITDIIKHEWFPYYAQVIPLSLCYIFSQLDMEPALTFITALGTKVLSKYDFREYAPPIQNPALFELSEGPSASFKYNLFNYYYLIQTRNKSFQIDRLKKIPDTHD